MTHSRRIDRDHPCALVFLVDQSDSMEEALPGADGRPKRDVLAEVLDDLLFELVMRCVKSPQEGPRPYFAVEVLGYGTDDDGTTRVESALPRGVGHGGLRWTSDLADTPRRVDRRPAPSGEGTVAAPVWVEPLSRGGTPMCAALDRAGQLASRWIEQHPEAFPPIVINVTDGESTDGDPRTWAARLRSLRSADGPVLVFNLALSSDVEDPVLFPSSGDALPTGPATLFEMSSPLPDVMLEGAMAKGVPVTWGARAFGCNADLRSIVTFLNVGTSVGPY